MNEFEQAVVLEYTQSETVAELRGKANRDYYLSIVNAKTLETGLNSYVAKKAFATVDAIKNAEDNAVETRIYSIPDDTETPTVASDGCTAIFRVKTYGATVIKIRPDFPATVILFRYNRRLIGSNTRTQIAAFSMSPKDASDISDQWAAATVNLTSAEDCDGENEYLISVWQDQPGDIACCAGTNIDRLEHPLGGIWAAYANSPDPETGQRVSFIWYVPKEHIGNMYINIDTLAYETSAGDAISDIFSIASAAIGAVSIALAFMNVNTGLSFAVTSFAIGSLGPQVGETVSKIEEYISKLKAAIVKESGFDIGSLSHGTANNGIKLTVYPGIANMSDYQMEPWDGKVMEGAPGHVGEFLPVQDDRSMYSLKAVVKVKEA